MSLAEKAYLAMVVFLFVSFMVLMAVLCWLDAKDESLRRRRAGAEPAKKSEAPPAGAPAHH